MTASLRLMGVGVVQVHARAQAVVRGRVGAALQAVDFAVDAHFLDVNDVVRVQRFAVADADGGKRDGRGVALRRAGEIQPDGVLAFARDDGVGRDKSLGWNPHCRYRRRCG